LVPSNNNQRAAADARCDEDGTSPRSAKDDAGLVHSELAFDLEAAVGEQHCTAETIGIHWTSSYTIKRALDECSVVAAGGLYCKDSLNFWQPSACLIARKGEINRTRTRQWVK
jgi:hypothetical protein